MTAGSFDRLLYTDCRAGTGRGAGDGFQVQAQSADVDAAQAKMAVEWLLYEAPNAWIVQRRRLEDFPLGFAHASAAGYGTAQSRYVGTEATGARQGNHLADCLLTRDLALYGPTRPAQLWRSALWRSEAWDTSDCPQLDGTPPPGPLTVDAVADWLRRSPARAPALAKIVSVLEQAAGPHVVITADCPDEALSWIAAATLLLPIRAALDVSFKVFCSNPIQASHRVVAVLKELNPQVVPGRADSVFVLDAETAVCDEAEVSERARFWAQLFASSQDPYDVVDAVELADQMSPVTELNQPDAFITSWAVTVPDSPISDSSVLLRWLSAAEPKMQQEYGPAVVQRILTADPAAGALRWIDTAAALGNLDIDRGAIRASLLTAEIAEVRNDGAPPAEVLATVEYGEDTRVDAVSELSSAIVLSPDDEPRQIDQLLRLSRRHRIDPPLPALAGRLTTFVTRWLDDPEGDYHPDEWALREKILDIAHDQLHDRMTTAGARRLTGTLQQVWRHFADRPGDPADPLYCHLQIAALTELSSQRKLSRLSQLLRQAVAADEPVAATSGIQQALMDWQALDSAEACLILSALPVEFPAAGEVSRRAIAGIRQVAGQPSALALDALGMLSLRGGPPLKEPLAGLLAADRDVMDFIQVTTVPRFLDDRSFFHDWLVHLGQANPAVIRARLGKLLQACLDLPTPGLGAWLISGLPSPLPRRLISLWAKELGGPQTTRATIEGFWWHADAEVPARYKSSIEETITRFGSSLALADRDRWFLLVREAIGPEQLTAWARLANYEVAKPRRGLRGGKEQR